MPTSKTKIDVKFYDIERDGITQGLLYQFLECRQKARWFLQGYSAQQPSLALEFGTVVHEVLAKGYDALRQEKVKLLHSPEYVRKCITEIEKTWRTENPQATPQALQNLELALLFAEAVMPMYFEYWREDLAKMSWVSIESSFDLPYVLKDGRKTRLRGKFDGSFIRNKKLWLNENKTKSRIEEENLVDFLPFELQVNLYLRALRRVTKQTPHGVLYNVIRRPGLKQKQDESLVAFAARCANDVKERPEWYFLNYEISISSQEMDRWDGELEDLLTDFYNWWEGKSGHYRSPSHCENKYGRCTYLDACASRMTRYIKRAKVFRELEDL